MPYRTPAPASKELVRRLNFVPRTFGSWLKLRLLCSWRGHVIQRVTTCHEDPCICRWETHENHFEVPVILRCIRCQAVARAGTEYRPKDKPMPLQKNGRPAPRMPRPPPCPTRVWG